MTDTTNKPGRTKLSIGGSRPKLGLTPSTSKPVGDQKSEPVMTRRKKKVVVVGKSARPSRKPVRDPELKAKEEAAAKSKQKESQEIEAAKRRVIEAGRWLRARFPEIFDPKSPKPLAIGITKDIGKVHKAEGGVDVLGFGWHPLKKAVEAWVNSKIYQEACLADGAVRHGINPDAPEKAFVITKEDKKEAKKRLNRALKKSKQNKKKLGRKRQTDVKRPAPKAK